MIGAGARPPTRKSRQEFQSVDTAKQSPIAGDGRNRAARSSSLTAARAAAEESLHASTKSCSRRRRRPTRRTPRRRVAHHPRRDGRRGAGRARLARRLRADARTFALPRPPLPNDADASARRARRRADATSPRDPRPPKSARGSIALWRAEAAARRAPVRSVGRRRTVEAANAPVTSGRDMRKVRCGPRRESDVAGGQ